MVDVEKEVCLEAEQCGSNLSGARLWQNSGQYFSTYDFFPSAASSLRCTLTAYTSIKFSRPRSLWLAEQRRRASPARRRITSLEHKLCASCRYPFQTSGDYASSKASTQDSREISRKPANPRHIRRPFTTPKTSSTSSTNLYWASFENRRRLKRRLPGLLVAMRFKMLFGWRNMASPRSSWITLCANDILPSSTPYEISTTLSHFSFCLPIYPRPPKYPLRLSLVVSACVMSSSTT